MNSWHRFAGKAFVMLVIILTMSHPAFSVRRPVTSIEFGPERSPIRPASPELTGAYILAELLAHNRLRDKQLAGYSTVRTYQVMSDRGKLYASEVVRMHYHAPDHMRFSIASAQGLLLVRDLVLKRLMESEVKASAGKARRNTSLRPANYSFQLLGEQNVGAYNCYVVQATPRRADKHLFKGKVWIDTEGYGVVRISGQPAGKLSFWIESAHFVRQYQEIDGFWLPWKDESTVHVRFAGTKILTIVHRQYIVNGRAASALHAIGPSTSKHESTPVVKSLTGAGFAPGILAPRDGNSHTQIGADRLH
jgi:hypothetical protein